MQSPPLVQPAAASPRTLRALLPALAILALLCSASPADALPTFSTERPDTPLNNPDSLGVGVGVEVDPESGRVGLRLCVEHDPDWHFPFDAGQDDDGDLAVWVSLGLDPSSGSEKADTSCLRAWTASAGA
jgi:hypothetical protein